jgi:hypothetical protein
VLGYALFPRRRSRPLGAFQVFVRPGQNIHGSALHARRHSVMWHSDEVDARPDFRLNALYKQVEEPSARYILHNQAARLRSRLHAAFSADLRWFLGRHAKSDRGGREHNRDSRNWLPAHSYSPFDLSDLIPPVRRIRRIRFSRRIEDHQLGPPAQTLHRIHQRC